MKFIEKIKRQITIGECEKNIGIPVYISDLKAVLSELEKKEKIIDEMSNFINLISNELVAETGDNNLEFCKTQKCIDDGDLDCADCIKQYFTNKVEKEGVKDE